MWPKYFPETGIANSRLEQLYTRIAHHLVIVQVVSGILLHFTHDRWLEVIGHRTSFHQRLFKIVCFVFCLHSCCCAEHDIRLCSWLPMRPCNQLRYIGVGKLTHPLRLQRLLPLLFVALILTPNPETKRLPVLHFRACWIAADVSSLGTGTLHLFAAESGRRKMHSAVGTSCWLGLVDRGC